MEEHSGQGGRYGLRRDRTQLWLPAWHERARHGLGGGPSAGIHRNGRALVQALHPLARHREAHAQYHRHSPARSRGQGGGCGCSVADQYHQLHHWREPGHHGDVAQRGGDGLARWLLRPGGETHCTKHGGRDCTRSANGGSADFRHWRHQHLARRSRVHRSRLWQCSGVHGGHGVWLQDCGRHGKRPVEFHGRKRLHVHRTI